MKSEGAGARTCMVVNKMCFRVSIYGSLKPALILVKRYGYTT